MISGNQAPLLYTITMYHFLFIEMIRLSKIYNRALERLEPIALDNLEGVEASEKQRNLMSLHDVNKRTMNNCVGIVTRLKDLTNKGDN